MKYVILIALLLSIAVGALFVWRLLDESARRESWQALLAMPEPVGNGSPVNFSRIATLPPVAARFLSSAIAPDAIQRTRAIIEMHGEFRLGDAESPRAFAMQARQLLAPPHGFVWHVTMGSGALRFSGSDGATPTTSWTRFWLAGLLPLVRAGGNPDHALSSFGRYMSEAILWTPAALLPSDTVHWEDIDADTTRVTVTAHGLQQAFDLHLDADGLADSIVFQRWTDANDAKRFQRQPFGGVLSGFRWFDGYRIPTRIEAGNFFGTDDYFPFFEAVIDDIDYL